MMARLNETRRSKGWRRTGKRGYQAVNLREMDRNILITLKKKGAIKKEKKERKRKGWRRVVERGCYRPNLPFHLTPSLSLHSFRKAQANRTASRGVEAVPSGR